MMLSCALRQPRSTRQIWARCSVRRALLKPTCKTPSWLRPCLKTEWAWWPRASIRNCRLAMNVPAQLSPPEIATPPRHWMASWYPSCRARLTRNMPVCQHQPASLHNDKTTPQRAASSFVNPLTALCFLETMRMENHTGLVHTAAASNLGQMLVRLCAAENVPLVNIVRSEEQAATLRALSQIYLQFSRC